MTSGTDGILLAIDNALSDFSVSGDAMRCQPPVTTVTFTWDSEAETGSAIFTGVDIMALDSTLRIGIPVFVNGRKYIVVEKIDDSDRGYVIELEPA